MKACVSYGFLHLIINWFQFVVLLLFVNNAISTLILLCYTSGLHRPGSILSFLDNYFDSLYGQIGLSHDEAKCCDGESQNLGICY